MDDQFRLTVSGNDADDPLTDNEEELEDLDDSQDRKRDSSALYESNAVVGDGKRPKQGQAYAHAMYNSLQDIITPPSPAPAPAQDGYPEDYDAVIDSEDARCTPDDPFG